MLERLCVRSAPAAAAAVAVLTAARGLPFCSHVRPVLEPVVAEAEVRLRFPDPEMLGPPVIEFSDVWFQYGPTAPPVFVNASFSARMGSKVAIVPAAPARACARLCTYD